MKIFSDMETTGYRFPAHPEGPERVARSFERLKAAGLPPEPPPVTATEKDILRVHTPAHWSNLRAGSFSDPDTPFSPLMPRLAVLALSGALSAAESARAGEPAFSLMRPPGHHAGRERPAGFCYLNHIAAAAARLREAGNRVAVLDIDVHHGDGTEEIAFGRDGWLYVSLHQSPLYPGTGLVSRGNCRNHPLPPFTEDRTYFAAFEEALKEVVDFKPDLLAVSAGFDTYREDPLAQFRLTKPMYQRLGRAIAETGLPRFAVLEGGYAPDLPELIERFVNGFSG